MASINGGLPQVSLSGDGGAGAGASESTAEIGRDDARIGREDAQVAVVNAANSIKSMRHRQVIIYVLIALIAALYAARIESINSRGVTNQRLLVQLLNQQCIDTNVASKAFNSQHPPPTYQRPYRDCTNIKP